MEYPFSNIDDDIEGPTFLLFLVCFVWVFFKFNFIFFFLGGGGVGFFFVVVVLCLDCHNSNRVLAHSSHHN